MKQVLIEKVLQAIPEDITENIKIVIRESYKPLSVAVQVQPEASPYTCTCILLFMNIYHPGIPLIMSSSIGRSPIYTVNVEIFAQYIFSRISRMALHARKYDVSEKNKSN